MVYLSTLLLRTNESRQRGNEQKEKIKKLLTTSCDCDKISTVVKTTRSTEKELQKINKKVLDKHERV